MMELSRSSSECSAVAVEVLMLSDLWPLLDDGEWSVVALVFELKASTSMLGEERTTGRTVVDSMADGWWWWCWWWWWWLFAVTLPLVTATARRVGSWGVSLFCGTADCSGGQVGSEEWLLVFMLLLVSTASALQFQDKPLIKNKPIYDYLYTLCKPR